MFSIRRVLENKADSTLWSVQPGDTVLAAITLMAEQRIGAVLVMDGDELVGILSERDYSRKCVLQGRRSADTVVSEIMTREVVTVPPTMTAREGLELMTHSFFRHLPVVEDGKLIGVVSIGDLVKRVIAEQDFLIEQLEQYIIG
jgi:CBS domain-containing protein